MNCKTLMIGAVSTFAWLSACSQRPPQPAPSPVPPPASAAAVLPSASNGAPMVVSIVGPTKITPGQPVELKIIIERTMKGTPLFLKLTLPPGAELAKGHMGERIDDDANRIERTIVLSMIGETPASDVKVSVDAGGQGFGVHATAAYRFGRPDPLMPEPSRTGAPLILDGRDVGRPIPVGKQ